MNISNRPLFIAVFAATLGAVLPFIITNIVQTKSPGPGGAENCGISGKWIGNAKALVMPGSAYNKPLYEGPQNIEVEIECKGNKVFVEGTAGVPPKIAQEYGIATARLSGEAEINSADPFDMVLQYNLTNNHRNPEMQDHHRASGAYVARLDPTKNEITGYYLAMSDLTKKLRPDFPYGLGWIELKRNQKN